MIYILIVRILLSILLHGEITVIITFSNEYKMYISIDNLFHQILMNKVYKIYTIMVNDRIIDYRIYVLNDAFSSDVLYIFTCTPETKAEDSWMSVFYTDQLWRYQ